MNWDTAQVTYSSQGAAVAKDGSAKNSVNTQSKYRQFLREFRKGGVEETFYYRELLKSNYDQRIYYIEVDFEELTTFNPELSELFRESPSVHLPLFENAAQEVVAMAKVPRPSKEEMHDIQVQIVNLSRVQVPIRELHARHISKLVKVPGIIISSGKPSCKATSITLCCTSCRASITRSRVRGFGHFQIPRQCENASDEKNDRKCPLDPFMILADKCSFQDIQKLKLQEHSENIPTGEMPRHLWLFCERHLVNRIKPGSRVNIIGIYKTFDLKKNSSSSSSKSDNMDISVRKPYLEVIGIEEENVSQKRGLFTSAEEEAIRDLSRTFADGVYENIAKSIAPAIWGNLDIKKAIACLLFGGSRKVLSDNMRLRGDINVLLLGDPSVAKSQFLKFVDEVAPIAVYTSGKGSSAAGLTASVIKESGTGEFHLEAGAMVLADGGVVCIDEFDKMRESDRVAIHEAMEQQTISIAKAGITTILNSRTSVLAAANPVFGRYDEMRSTSDNIDFETTILSRFDLIFIIRDIKDVARDQRLAKHVMGLHIDTSHKQGKQAMTSATAPVSASLLSKYIAYARHNIHPRLTKKAAKMLGNHYVTFRKEAKMQAEITGSQSAIPLTVRQLESLVRLSEAIAKMELASEANEEHVKEAVRLFKVATLKAAKEGNFMNSEGALGGSNGKLLKEIQKCERNLKRRVVIGSKTSVSKLVSEMARRNILETVVLRALDIMHSRGEIEYRQKRRQVYRRK